MKLTQDEMQEIARQTREDFQAALEETRRYSAALDEAYRQDALKREVANMTTPEFRTSWLSRLMARLV